MVTPINDPSSRPPKPWKLTYWGGNFTPEQATNKAFPHLKNVDLLYPLSQVKVGQTVWVIYIQGESKQSHLIELELVLGKQVQIMSTQPSGSVILVVQGNHLGIGADLAKHIFVSENPSLNRREVTLPVTYLREMPLGAEGNVVGYDQKLRGYQGKLIAMGLIPFTQFTLLRVFSEGNWVEIELHGTSVRLSMQEADALVVEEIKFFDVFID